VLAPLALVEELGGLLAVVVAVVLLLLDLVVDLVDLLLVVVMLIQVLHLRMGYKIQVVAVDLRLTRQFLGQVVQVS
jgi:hypothetical protein